MAKRKIKIHPITFFFFLGMLASDRTHLAALTLLAAILHECGHVLAAYLMRIPLRELRLDLLGARLEICGRLLSYGEEWLLCAAGPLVSLLSAILLAPFWPHSPMLATFSSVSFLLGLLNLLPIRTFDGGRMTECALLSLFDPALTRRLMQGLSFFFLFLLWALAVYFLLRANDGLSLLFFCMSLFSRFFSEKSEGEIL